jgi:cytochrome bd-type quinol oxidase subunit 2
MTGSVLIFDAASEGKSIITVMLVVGLIFLGVIILGGLWHWAGERRRERRRARRAY